MNKNKCIIIILIIILTFITGSCTNKVEENPTLIVDDYNGIDINKIPYYKIEVELDVDNKTYTAKQKVDYINSSEDEFKNIYFHLYPNAYKSVETAPVLFDNVSFTEEDFEPGYIEINDILIDKKPATFHIEGIDDTILKIDLPFVLKPDEKLEIYLEYNVKLPLNVDRFGYGEEIFNFGNWYPIACVYDDKGWNLDPFYDIGDPFYSEIGNYDVIITVPKDFVVASSGNITHEKVKKDKKIYTIEGKLIRDFAWVASSKFKITEKDINGTTVKLYSLEEKREMENFASKVGVDAINIFNRIFGKYPYGQYSIVMTEFPTGMEYPTIVFIGKNYFTSNSKDILETVIVHETAHQWWYGVVGNDQIDEAWLDESFATYSEVIYIGEKYGEKLAKEYYNYYCKNNYEYGKFLITKDEIINKPLDQFKDWDDYGLLVYSKGAMFLNEIEEDFGKEILYDILNKYYNTYKFHNATTEDFIKTCEEVTGTSFDERVAKWLYEKD